MQCLCPAQAELKRHHMSAPIAKTSFNTPKIFSLTLKDFISLDV